MKRLIVNDQRNTLGERTFWDLLCEWFGAEFVGGPYDKLADLVALRENASLIIRNGTWFKPINHPAPQIALLQDIILDGEVRKMQEAVCQSARVVVFNSAFTASNYGILNDRAEKDRIIPLPVDFSLFEPRNKMGMQQFLGIPAGAVCWVGSQHPVKGYDIFLAVVRANPDIPFVAVFKDRIPDSFPPNLRCFARVSQQELAGTMSACRVGLCTSRMETQHLAGIEMMACGLPMVAPPVGIYWRGEFPGVCVTEPTPQKFSEVIRETRNHGLPAAIREWAIGRFDIPVIKAQWESLVKEVECSGQS